jgi:hypothetical protein
MAFITNHTLDRSPTVGAFKQQYIRYLILMCKQILSMYIAACAIPKNREVYACYGGFGKM